MTEAALLEALRAAVHHAPGGDGLRVEEIAVALQRPEAYVRTLVREALQARTIRRTTRIIEQINGTMRRVPAYEAVP